MSSEKYRSKVLRKSETGEYQEVGFYRHYPPGVVDPEGRYVGPGFDDDRHLIEGQHGASSKS
jgi:hypothetical protein